MSASPGDDAAGVATVFLRSAEAMVVPARGARPDRGYTLRLRGFPKGWVWRGSDDTGPSPGCTPGRSPGSGRDQSFADGVAHEPGGVVDVELVHHPAAVKLGGLDADVQQVGDLLGRFALGDELYHLPLPRAQRAARVGVCAG